MLHVKLVKVFFEKKLSKKSENDGKYTIYLQMSLFNGYLLRGKLTILQITTYNVHSLSPQIEFCATFPTWPDPPNDQCAK